MEFYIFDLFDNVLSKYFNSCSLTLDTIDFVEPKALKKVRKDLFKEYKRKIREAKRKYRSFKWKYKKHRNSLTSEYLNKLYAKYDLEFENALVGLGSVVKEINTCMAEPVSDLKDISETKSSINEKEEKNELESL